MRSPGGKALLASVVFPAVLFLTAASAPVFLSPYAEEVAQIIKFDRQVLLLMKSESGGSIHRMIGYDENNFQIIVDGLFVPVPDDRTDAVLASLRKKIAPLKYMAFVIEMNGNIKTDKIGVLKGTDQFDILRVMHTDGEEYDISNQDVIERLQEWEKTSPFAIIGADKDWVEIEFKTLPKDLIDFVDEVYDFCPDAVDQGWGNTAGLVKEIQETRRLFLWWD